MKTDEKLLGKLMDLTVEHLIARVKSGEVTAAELATIRQILRDNGIQIEIEEGDALDILKKSEDLPFDTEFYDA